MPFLMRSVVFSATCHLSMVAPSCGARSSLQLLRKVESSIGCAVGRGGWGSTGGDDTDY